MPAIHDRKIKDTKSLFHRLRVIKETVKTLTDKMQQERPAALRDVTCHVHANPVSGRRHEMALAARADDVTDVDAPGGDQIVDYDVNAAETGSGSAARAGAARDDGRNAVDCQSVTDKTQPNTSCIDWQSMQ